MHVAITNPESLTRHGRLIQSTYRTENTSGVRARIAAALPAAFQAQRGAATHLPAGEPGPRLPRIKLSAEAADPRSVTMDQLREAAAETTRLLYGTVAGDGTRFLHPDHEAALLQALARMLGTSPRSVIRVPGRGTTGRSAWSI